MFIGKVVGSVVSTRKNERLVGSKFMIVETCEKMGEVNLEKLFTSLKSTVGDDVKNVCIKKENELPYFQRRIHIHIPQM